jgi:hypothetical protein
VKWVDLYSQACGLYEIENYQWLKANGYTTIMMISTTLSETRCKKGRPIQKELNSATLHKGKSVIIVY